MSMIAYILISWIAVSAHTAVVKKFGGVAAVFVGTARKGMTLILSFVLFPKESNWKYAVGAVLVLGGLTIASLEKQRNKRNIKIESRDGSKQLPLVPSLPFQEIRNPSDSSNGNGESRTEEQQPLINLDVELGRSSTSVSNRPERRR
mmetsp:Transcript_25938/g.47399  ORF Transcript_25938/g.47399 Transcript_25938/m.47399 type:complete len:147 (+) Transcript_25938:47-487(+)